MLWESDWSQDSCTSTHVNFGFKGYPMMHLSCSPSDFGSDAVWTNTYKTIKCVLIPTPTTQLCGEPYSIALIPIGPTRGKNPGKKGVCPQGEKTDGGRELSY